VNRKEVDNRDQALEYLSNRFYTYIPHNLGKKYRNSLIDSPSKIKAKNQLISSLIDIKTILKNEKEKKPQSPLDLNYESLNCELVPMDHSSESFKMIEKYATST
jgi:poly [ADP-ribose] polymerase